jgi:chromosome segregation ATPase
MNPKSLILENTEPDDLVSGGMSKMTDDINKLQETLDRLTAENNDLKDRINTLGVDYDYVKFCYSRTSDDFKTIQDQLEIKTTALLAALAKLDAANESIAKLNSIVQHEEWKQNRSIESAEKEQRRIQDNCNHLNDIVKTQSETIKIAGEKLTEAKINENHLAQKTIILYNENQRLNSRINELVKLNTNLSEQNEELSKLSPLNVDDYKKELEKYKSFYIKLGHEIFQIISCNPLKKPFKIYNLYSELSKYFADPISAPQHTPNTSK